MPELVKIDCVEDSYIHYIEEYIDFTKIKDEEFYTKYLKIRNSKQASTNSQSNGKQFESNFITMNQEDDIVNDTGDLI